MHRVQAIQSKGEIASKAAVIGASCNEVKALTATSGPRLDIIAENLGLAAMTETPYVSVEVMHCGPSTGKPAKPSQQNAMQLDGVLTETMR